MAPDAKLEARVAAIEAIADGGYGERELVVRVNALDTPWGSDDLQAIAGTKADAILLPKIGNAAALKRCHDIAPAKPLWAMIETAEAMLRLEEIASADGLEAMVLGTNDLAKELRSKPGADRLPFLGFFTQAVAVARYNGLAVLDGVYNAIDDQPGLKAECDQAARFGFDGKTLIHPGQIDIANTAFSPSESEIAWARKIVGVFAEPENARRGAIRIDGQMVERLHLDQASSLLAMYDSAD